VRAVVMRLAFTAAATLLERPGCLPGALLVTLVSWVRDGGAGRATGVGPRSAFPGFGRLASSTTVNRLYGGGRWPSLASHSVSPRSRRHGDAGPGPSQLNLCSYTLHLFTARCKNKPDRHLGSFGVFRGPRRVACPDGSDPAFGADGGTAANPGEAFWPRQTRWPGITACDAASVIGQSEPHLRQMSWARPNQGGGSPSRAASGWWASCGRNEFSTTLPERDPLRTCIREPRLCAAGGDVAVR